MITDEDDKLAIPLASPEAPMETGKMVQKDRDVLWDNTAFYDPHYRKPETDAMNIHVSKKLMFVKLLLEVVAVYPHVRTGQGNTMFIRRNIFHSMNSIHVARKGCNIFQHWFFTCLVLWIRSQTWNFPVWRRPWSL